MGAYVPLWPPRLLYAQLTKTSDTLLRSWALAVELSTSRASRAATSEEYVTSRQTYDAIVVGSGPGGGTVARELARSGAKVLVLERGSDAPVKGTVLQTLRWLGTPGSSLVLTASGLPIVRGLTLGGSSIFYFGTAYPPPLTDFARWGIDLAPVLAEARDELPIGPLSDRLLGPMSRMIMDSAQRLGLPWKPLDKFIDQEHCRPECWRCTYGCPYGAKWNSRMYLTEAAERGVVVHTQAKVLRVLQRDGKAYGVEFQQDGTTQQVHAETVVLSAGGLGTPEILGNSGITNAGRDFFVDPLITVFGFVEKPKEERVRLGLVRGHSGREIPMSTGMRAEEDGYVMTDMTVPPALFRTMALSAGRLWRLSQHHRALSIMIKIKDDLAGEIVPGKAVRKPLTTDDKRKLSHGYRQAKAILHEAGAEGVFHSATVAAHPGGTAKIGEVVDTDLQTEYKNLYVCDCSVIPEAWGLPPTLSLICLGKRLARHLSQQDQATSVRGEVERQASIANMGA